MPRLPHGKVVTLEEFQSARAALAERSADVPLGFAAAQPVITTDFGFLFSELQQDPNDLLPESRATRDALVELGRTMLDEGGDAGDGDSRIPAAYTYFGQFVDHDITLEAQSATLPDLVDPDLVTLTPEEIEDNVQKDAPEPWSWTASTASRRRATARRCGSATSARSAAVRRARTIPTTCRGRDAAATPRATARPSSATRATTRTPSSRSCTSPSCAPTTRWWTETEPSGRRGGYCASTTSTSSSTTSSSGSPTRK